jgi:hypothetical protein
MPISHTFRETAMPANEKIASGLVLVGGGVLLLYTLLGLAGISIYVYRNISDVTTALCLILAFPIFLIGLKSLRVATGLLWVFFVAQWANASFVSVPPQLVNPLDWPYGVMLCGSIVLVQVGYLILSRVSKNGSAVNLVNLFEKND